MKARIKKTGEIVNLASYATITLNVCDSWGNPIEMKPEEIELIQDKTNDFDWQSFRAEAAKDFTVAILSNPRWSEHFKATDKDFRFDEAYYKKVVIGNALSYTDELIKQLKEKEEK